MEAPAEQGARPGFKFVRQAPVGPYTTADFLRRQRSLIVEIDGETHSSAAEIAHDAMRTTFLVSCGYRVIRFDNAQLYENIEAVMEGIYGGAPWERIDVRHSPRPSPHLSPQAGRVRGGFRDMLSQASTRCERLARRPSSNTSPGRFANHPLPRERVCARVALVIRGGKMRPSVDRAGLCRGLLIGAFSFFSWLSRSGFRLFPARAAERVVNSHLRRLQRHLRNG